MHSKRYRIIDTTALLTWHIPFDKDAINVTTGSVLKEIKKDELTKSIIDSYLETKRIVVMNPKEEYINKAYRLALETGDKIKMSDTDIEIVALVLQLVDEGGDVEVITDDYSIQNILQRMNINILSYFRKIKNIYNWVLVCEKCGKKYPSDYDREYCEVCGGRIIRKRESL